MTDSPSIETQPEPENVARAGDLLESLLAGDLDTDARLAIGAALDVLYDVHPPYPPRPQPEPATVDLPTGVRLALKALSDAERAASSVGEAIRMGLAARELHPVRDR
jgi:hypothetical protein